MIGRHFLIYSKKHILIKRQYTICCSIVPKVYNELLKICNHILNLNEEKSTTKIDFDHSVFDSKD